MNRTLSSYLANVATAAEHAPFGVPGLWHMNQFFNNALVYAALSVVTARNKFATDEAYPKENLDKAIVRFHSIKSLYDEYGSSVAINHLEMPHVARALNLDVEPDIAAKKAAAKKAAMAAVQSALITGRKTEGLFGATYAKHIMSLEATRALRKSQLEDVYAQIHTEVESHLIDEAEIEGFNDRLYSQCMSIARANWLASEAALTDTSMPIFYPDRYLKLKAANEGCLAFLIEHGITIDKLRTWNTNVQSFTAKEAAAYEGTLAEAEKAATEEMAAFEHAEAAEEAKAVAQPKRYRVPSKAYQDRLDEASQAQLAREAEDKQPA